MDVQTELRLDTDIDCNIKIYLQPNPAKIIMVVNDEKMYNNIFLKDAIAETIIKFLNERLLTYLQSKAIREWEEDKNGT